MTTTDAPPNTQVSDPDAMSHRQILEALTGLLAAYAILHAQFWLFCVATFLGGLYGAVSQSYRFAAADGASVAASRVNAPSKPANQR